MMTVLKRMFEKGVLMCLGALILLGGLHLGSGISGTSRHNLFYANNDEALLKSKSEVIDNIVKVDSGISNKFIASRKASELSNLDISKLNKLRDKGIVVVVIPQEDVYSLLDPDRAVENEKNGIATDSIYIPEEKKVVISLYAPNGVLSNQVSNIIK